MNGARSIVTWSLTTFTVVPRPDRALTRVWCATVLTWIQVCANRGPDTILCTVLWMYPVTALVIDGPNDCSSRRPGSVPCPAVAWRLARSPRSRCRWVVIAVVTLSVSAFCTAGSWISGSILAMYRLVSETWLALHTATTEIGARMQPTTISTVATGPRQPGRRRRRSAPCRSRSSLISARSRSSSSRSSWLRSGAPATLPRSALSRSPASVKRHLPWTSRTAQPWHATARRPRLRICPRWPARTGVASPGRGESPPPPRPLA